MFRFELGQKLVDTVTNFEGIVVGRAEHLTGCNTYGLQPPAKDGDFKDSKWFDEHRLTRADPSLYKLPIQQQRAADTGATGVPEATRTVG